MTTLRGVGAETIFRGGLKKRLPWARAFRSQEYHAVVNTNIGSESLNKVLKYRFLPCKKHEHDIFDY